MISKVRSVCPFTFPDLTCQEILHEIRPVIDKFWQRPFLAGKRIIQRAFLDEPSHRIQIRSRYFATKPHCLQRNRPTTRKWVQHLRRASAIEFANLVAQFVYRWIILLPPRKHAALDRPFLLGHRIAIFILLGHHFHHDLTANEIQQLLAIFRIARVWQQSRQ